VKDRNNVQYTEVLQEGHRLDKLGTIGKAGTEREVCLALFERYPPPVSCYLVTLVAIKHKRKSNVATNDTEHWVKARLTHNILGISIEVYLQVNIQDQDLPVNTFVHGTTNTVQLLSRVESNLQIILYLIIQSEMVNNIYLKLQKHIHSYELRYNSKICQQLNREVLLH